MRGCATRRTPGSNGAARSFCRTRRCIRSPNGAASASAAPTCRPSSASRTWRIRWRWSSSIRRRTLRLLAPLLDIPLPPERAPSLAPEELRRRQLAALTNWVMAGARAQPVVLAFEDLHWADPTTLDVLRGIAERGALAPLFVVATTPARVPAALGHALASRHDLAGAARSPPGAAHGGGACRPPRAAEGRGRGRNRAHRRRAAVRRGSDAAPCWSAASRAASRRSRRRCNNR